MAVALRTLPHASSMRSRSSYMAAQSGASHAGADAGAGPAPSPGTQGPGSQPRSASSCCRRATSLSRAARRSLCFFLQRLGGGWSGGRSTWVDVARCRQWACPRAGVGMGGWVGSPQPPPAPHTPPGGAPELLLRPPILLAHGGAAAGPERLRPVPRVGAPVELAACGGRGRVYGHRLLQLWHPEHRHGRQRRGQQRGRQRQRHHVHARRQACCMGRGAAAAAGARARRAGAQAGGGSAGREQTQADRALSHAGSPAASTAAPCPVRGFLAAGSSPCKCRPCSSPALAAKAALRSA